MTDKFQPPVEVVLGAGLALGPSKAIEWNEREAGARLREQDLSDWLDLPAALETTGVYCHLGYYESMEAEALGWQPPPGKRPLHSVNLYMINKATYEEAGFVFHSEDIAGYISYLEWSNVDWPRHQRQDKWMHEHDCYYAGHGEEPYKSQADKMRRARYEDQRWVQNYYLRDQRLGPVFVRGRLPEGWRMADDGHRYGYWTTLLDADGNDRGSIFYKALESCHMRLDIERDWYHGEDRV